MTVQRCSRCVTPATWPGLTFDDQGVCDLCRAFERRWSKWLASKELQDKSLKELDKIIKKAIGSATGKFHLMIPISGGKDSLYVLYWVKKHYDVSVLSYTYDNGLMDAEALRNIEIAKDKLGITHIMETLPFQHELVRHFMEKTGNFCGACVIPYLIGAHRCAREHQIPLLIFGLSKRDDANGPDGMNPFFFFNVVNDGFGKSRFEEHWGPNPIRDYILDAASGKHQVINLPDYMLWDEEQIQAELERELGVSLGHEHFDCKGHEVAYWLTAQRYGFSTLPIKLSQKIRSGKMTRAEALEILEREETHLPDSAEEFARIVGSTPQQVAASASRSMKPYFAGVGNFLAVQHRKWFLRGWTGFPFGRKNR